MTEDGSGRDHHVCPFWIGYLLASPLRKLLQDPHKILAQHVKPGMHVLDIGSAMGFFSLPMAEMVGDDGRVTCVDIQQKMLDALMRRARKAGLDRRIETRLSTPDALGISDLSGQIDFALAFAVVHEAANPARFFAGTYAALRPGGRVLLAEPKGHVKESAFRESIAIAETQGLHPSDSPVISRSQAVVLGKG